MKHLSQEQIVLHYYGDAEDEQEVLKHIGECSTCRDEFERVRLLLERIEPSEVNSGVDRSNVHHLSATDRRDGVKKIKM